MKSPAPFRRRQGNGVPRAVILLEHSIGTGSKPAIACGNLPYARAAIPSIATPLFLPQMREDGMLV